VTDSNSEQHFSSEETEETEGGKERRAGTIGPKGVEEASGVKEERLDLFTEAIEFGIGWQLGGDFDVLVLKHQPIEHASTMVIVMVTMIMTDKKRLMMKSGWGTRGGGVEEGFTGRQQSQRDEWCRRTCSQL